MNSSKTSNVNEEAKAKIDTKKRIIIKDNVITRTRNEGNPALDALIRNEERNKKPTSELIDAKIKSREPLNICLFILSWLFKLEIAPKLRKASTKCR
jgi:hypothetical protein